MTDHLEELLEQLAPDEEEQEELWTGARAKRLAPVVQRDAGLAESEVVPVAKTQEEETSGRSKDAPTLAGWLTKLRQAVQRGQERPQNRRGGSVGEGQSLNDSGLQGGRLTAFGAAHYAAMVDAAFQRDARRYDGPLGLLW